MKKILSKLVPLIQAHPLRFVAAGIVVGLAAGRVVAFIL